MNAMADTGKENYKTLIVNYNGKDNDKALTVNYTGK